MKTRRWALALTCMATAGTVAFVVGLPAGWGAAAPGRIELSARGDAMYFEVNSGSIPASPTNNASSLYMEAQLSGAGGGTATASSPFFGSTVQNLPGTANGVPPQFGSDLAFPFTRLPGYITCRDKGEENGQFAFGRVNAKCGPASMEAHGSQGAPPEIPAPNQQETADAATKIAEDGTSVAEATGTVKGFVNGPLEVGSAIATARIRHSNTGHKPEITSSTSGTFSVNGQQFGFTEKGITCCASVEPNDTTVTADPQLLEQAVINLLRNAADAARDVQPARIDVSCRTHEGTVAIEIADNGCGVPEAHRDQVFVPFFTTKVGGSGIGLNLARQIALAHGGQLAFRANAPHGSIFTLTLPADSGPLQ